MHLSDLPSGQEDDRWHQLMLSNTKSSPKGSVRFGALFKDYVILPVEEYSKLKEVCTCACACACACGYMNIACTCML